MKHCMSWNLQQLDQFILETEEGDIQGQRRSEGGQDRGGEEETVECGDAERDGLDAR